MRRRSGFTLVELLVVIGILMALTAITWVAVRGVMGTAREKATIATIRKIDALLTKRLEGFERQLIAQEEAAIDGMPQYVKEVMADVPLLQSLWNNGQQERARTLARKEYFRRHFPQTVSEVRGMCTGTAYACLGDGRFALGVTSDQVTNAEILYWLVTRAGSFGIDAVETDAFTANEFTDDDGDGFPHFVDGWGNPIVWYRWPTRLIRPAAAPTDVQTIDDPSGTPRYKLPIDTRFADAIWPGLEAYGSRGPGTTIMQEANDPLARDPSDPTAAASPTTPADAVWFERYFHTPDTFHLPLIVSGGPDGLADPSTSLGLFPPDELDRDRKNPPPDNHGRLAQPIPTATEKLVDNITNRNR